MLSNPSMTKPQEPPRFDLEISGQVLTGSLHSSTRGATVSYSILSPNEEDDWVLESGEASDISTKCHSSSDLFVFNLPIRCGFSSSTPFGWPRLVVSVFETDWRGRDVILGYGTVSVPSQPGRHRREILLVAPATSSWWERLVNWISGERRIFTNPLTFFTKPQSNRETVVAVTTGCSLDIEFNIIITGGKELNLHFE